MYRSFSLLGFLLVLLFTVNVYSQDLSDTYYDIGSPSVEDVYVDPVNGSDERDGRSPSQAWRSLNAAWQSIPQGTELSRGVRINILPGTLAEEDIPNYLESRYGTYEHPIIIQAFSDADSAILGGDLNVYDTRYLYLLNITISANGDTFHCEKCDYILLRGGRYDGGEQAAHETIKFNQSQHVYIEQANISGADDNAIDFVAVQHGHIIYNRIHNAHDWCAYVKGGSAYIRIEGNEIYNCGTGGVTAGQGSGGEFMTSPWLHYEAQDIKIVNNVIHDTEGAGLGVNGGYNILLAHNTLYRVGARSHALEVVYGLRSCDGNVDQCNTHLMAGGWQSLTTGGEGEPIGNRNVFVYNNVIYNPVGFSGPGQLFAVYGPRTPAGGTNLSSPQVTDDNLRIAGNLIFSGPGSTFLGIEDSSEGCQPSNSLCNAAQLTSENTINMFEPEFIDPDSGDFRPVAEGNLYSVNTAALLDFSGGDRPGTPLAPEGVLVNRLVRDRGLVERSSGTPPGAYASATSNLVPPGSGGSGGSGSSGNDPIISSASCAPRRGKAGVRVRCTVNAADEEGIDTVVVSIGTVQSKALGLRRGAFRGRFVAQAGKGVGVATVTDSDGNTVSLTMGKFRYSKK